MEASYNRLAELEAFDATKEGVKGLVDSGITRIPRYFIRPEAERDADSRIPIGNPNDFQIPVINLEGLNGCRCNEIVAQVRNASETWGFFQLMNHPIPVRILDEVIEGTRRFFEQDKEIKKMYYNRDSSNKVRYNSNFDLFKSTAVNWRDTFNAAIKFPSPPKPEELPEANRDILLEYAEHTTRLGETICELLSEALRLKPDHLKELDCAKWSTFSCHYYPACPEPKLTMGASKHSDATFFTVLLQGSKIGGFQVLHQGCWVDIPPIRGALTINIGDFLQIMSNGRFISSEHRVIANERGPRISVGCFFTTLLEKSLRQYGPIEELLSKDKPEVYQKFLISDYTTYLNSKGLNGIPALENLKLLKKKAM